MKSFIIKYKDYEDLNRVVSDNDISSEQNVLVQVFTGITSREFINEVIKDIQLAIPSCHIIGTTSAAEINKGKIITKSCVISISVFEHSNIKTFLLDDDDNDFNIGYRVGKELINKDTKAIITFISLSIDGQDYLDGINSVSNGIAVAGGVAGSSELESQCVFTEKGIGTGIAAAALNSTVLYVNCESCYNWIPIGRDHVITSCEGKKIKTIDGIKASEFYKRYTGITENSDVMSVGSQFPLVSKKNDNYISNPVLGFTKEGGLEVELRIKTGDNIRIGYGDLGEVLDGIRKAVNNVMKYPIEEIFVYSCNSRMRFLKDKVKVESSLFGDFPSVTGFYTLGEFNYINKKNIFMTETMTILILSEDIKAQPELNIDLTELNKNYSESDNALYNLIKTTGEELNELNQELEEKVKVKTSELIEQYNIDTLTGLYNRNKLIIDLVQKKISKLAILDIKSFSCTNDFYGNKVGNLLLVEVAKLIKSFCKKRNLHVYRSGGDTFAISSSNQDKDDFQEYIKVLQLIINDYCFLEDEYKIFLTINIGLAKEEENLLEKAEMALNYGKQNKSVFNVYKSELNLYEKIEKNIIWTNRIKLAIVQDRIKPYFQPILDNHNGKIEKYEALIRMIDENGAVISPAYFLEISKKSGLYCELTRIMIEKTFEVLYQTDLKMSINLLLQDIVNKATRNLILQKLSQISRPERIVFEIVESEGIENFEVVNNFISDIKKYGAKIAIDDFGTGYSNFSYLMKLNVDYIKIDGSLVKNVNNDKSAEIIIKTLVDFAKELDIKTVAEFVCDQNVYECVKKLNIDFSQGYYISEPKPEIDLELSTINDKK